MTNETLHKANELKDQMEWIEYTVKILGEPVPKLSSYNNEDVIAFNHLGKEISDELKKIMTEYLEQKYYKLKEEFDKL